MDELISRQSAQHKINAIIDEFETIMKDIRERHVNDSVCGLCEYDGAFIGQSGNWCHECPGFYRDDCFKLKDQYREEWIGAIKNLPAVQPTLMRSIGKLVGYTGEPCPNCGRLRVERYESGLEICEKCNWCEQTKSYWLDGVF